MKIVEHTAYRIIKRFPNLLKYLPYVGWVVQLPVVNRFYRMTMLTFPNYIRNEAYGFDVIYSKFPYNYLEHDEETHLAAILNNNGLKICEDLLLIRFGDGLKLLFHPAAGGMVLNKGTYWDYLSRCGVKLNKGDIVIDIGAHIGAFAVPAFYYDRVKIFCYEPHPTNYKLLKANFELNDKRASGGFVVGNTAVSSAGGISDFLYGNSLTTGTLIKGFFATIGTLKAISCKMVTLSSIFADNEINHCRMLKIDCEGSEYSILGTISDDNWRKIEYLAIEIHPIPGREPHELLSLLKEKNFTEVSSERREDGCYDCAWQNLLYR